VQNRKLDVFISYARADASRFVDELCTGLEVAGFRPLVDRQSISAAEEWEARIGSLVRQCDSVVAVITPVAVRSVEFRKEIDAAIGLSKRIIPVVWLETPVADIPPQLARLNFIFFSDGNSFSKGLKTLAEALESDLEWLREHTSLGDRAAEWADEHDRDPNALLTGPQVTEAEAWLARRPQNAPAPTPLMHEFIAASRQAETERESAERKRLAEIGELQQARADDLKRTERRTRLMMAGVAVLLAITGAVAYFAWSQKQAIEAADLRLRSGIKLRLANTERVVDIDDNWYRIVTDHKLAIGKISRGGSYFATGFLIQGSALHPEFGNGPLLLTANHIMDGAAERGDLGRFAVVFPAVDGERQVQFDSVAFVSRDIDVVAIRLKPNLPRGVAPVERIRKMSTNEVLDAVAVLHWSGEGFALGVGHGLPLPWSTPPAMPHGAKGTGVLTYTRASAAGSSGAPVFDPDKGDLVCIEQAATTASDKAPAMALCRSVADLIDAIAAERKTATAPVTKTAEPGR
jgi:hypothetical protein